MGQVKSKTQSTDIIDREFLRKVYRENGQAVHEYHLAMIEQGNASLQSSITFAAAALKAAFLSNSGAIIAIMAYLPTILPSGNKQILFAPLMIYICGVVCAMLATVFAHITQEKVTATINKFDEVRNDEQKIPRIFSFMFALGAIFAFLIASLLVALALT